MVRCNQRAYHYTTEKEATINDQVARHGINDYIIKYALDRTIYTKFSLRA